MNPFHWKREHQFAWLVACVLGSVVGMFYGLSRMVFAGSDGIVPATFFLRWLQRPEWYWPWAMFGAVIAGLAFYMARLLRA
jgi:hypothetical protein